jgi:hypothetical protein
VCVCFDRSLPQKKKHERYYREVKKKETKPVFAWLHSHVTRQD